MSYKIVKVATYYKDFIEKYYQQNTHIITASYQKQFDHLMFQSNAWADFYSKSFQKKGIKAYEIIANATHLQNRWGVENNCKKKGIQLVIEQLKQLNPEVVWFQNSLIYNGQLIRDIKNYIPSIKLVIGNSCAPYTKDHLKLFKEFDFITTCSPLFKETFEKNGIPSLLLYQAFDSKINDRINTQDIKKLQELIFTGTITAGLDGHNIRRQLLEKLLEKNIDISYYGSISNTKKRDVLKNQILYFFTKFIEKTGTSSLLKHSVIFKKGQFLTSFPKINKISKKLIASNKPSIYALNMFQKIANSKIGLNIHIDVAGDYAANMRMFETTGVGTCLLTDWKKNINELFEVDKEIVTYKSVDECVEKTKWLLENPKKREEIAKAGQKRTLKDHTYDNRAEKLLDKINKII